MWWVLIFWALWVSCEVELDDVGIERALGEEVDVAELAGLGVEDLDEGAADAAPLLLRVGHTGQGAQEALGGVDVHQVDVALVAHDLDDALTLGAAEQAVVDEHAGELVTDGVVHQRRRHRGIDAAAERAQHPPRADAGADVVDRHLDERRGLPGARAAADVDEEVAQDVAPQRRVHHLGVELDAEAAVGPADRRIGGVERVRHRVESRWHLGDDVAVGHPHVDLRGQPLEDAGALVDADRRVAVLATLSRLDGAAELVGEQLHAVADAEDGQVELVQGWIGQRGAARRTPRRGRR